MRQISQTLEDRIMDSNLVSFALFRIGPNPATNTLCYTTLPYDYINPVDGFTYYANNKVVRVDPPRISDSLDREAFKISIADSDGSIRSTLDGWNMHGVPFVLYAGIINNTNGMIDGTQPGAPFDDKIIAYEGTVDTFAYVITPDENVMLDIEGTSPMGALDLTRTLLTSKAYLNQEYPGDTSYDQVTEDSLKVTLLWGKS
jgi:hypothetical protein